MSIRVLDALPMLVLCFGETVNKVSDDRNGRLGLENRNKVMGFHSSRGRAIGLDVYPGNLERVRLWIEPPVPPPISGVTILNRKMCADLRRRELIALADGKGLYLEVQTKTALEEILKWYS